MTAPSSIVPLMRSLAWLLLVLGLSSCTPARAPGVSGSEVEDSILDTRVIASRREVRVVFPPETARAWGWADAREGEYGPRYSWRVSVEGAHEPRSLVLMVGEDPVRSRRARRFSSLARLVKAGSALLCSPGMISRCESAGVEAFVEGGSVVLVLRDSSEISRLFGMRPGWVQVRRTRPEEEWSLRFDSVRVEYVDPQVPVPDSAFLAEAARARRRYQERVNGIRRSITAGEQRWGVLWLAVGDSVPLWVEETRCRFDVCSSGWSAVADSGWTVTDTSVVRLQPFVRDTTRRTRRFWNIEHFGASVIGLRPGRAMVRVAGLHGPSDTMPSWRPVPRELEREVLVTHPLGRVEIVPRPDTVRVGARVEFRVRVVDRNGQPIEGAPVEFLVAGGGSTRGFGSGPMPFVYTFDEPGQRVLTASLGPAADTAVVTVVRRARR